MDLQAKELVFLFLSVFFLLLLVANIITAFVESKNKPGPTKRNEKGVIIIPDDEEEDW